LKTRNDTQIILAGALAIVMVASLVFPAYAERTSYVLTSIPEGTPEIATAASHNPKVFTSGPGPIPISGFFMDDAIIADDFVLDNPWIVTDAHFAFFCGLEIDCPKIEPLLYFFYEDNNGVPGAVIESTSGNPAQGTAIDVQVMPLPGGPFFDGDGVEVEHFEVWFDLEDSIPLDAGTTYWFGLTYTAPFEFEAPFPVILQTARTEGNVPAVTFDGSNWFMAGPGTLDLWFALSANQVVGGELLPIDTTALLIAGAKTNAVWILSALAVIGSLAFGALYITTKKN